MIGYLTRAVPEDWTSICEVCYHASSSESNAKEAIGAVRRELRSGDPPVQLSAARLWAIMLRNSPDMFLSESASRKFLDTLEELLQGRLTSPVVRERLLEVLGAATYASSSKADPELGLRNLWRRFKPFDKPDGGLPFDKDDPIFGPSVLSCQAIQRAQAPMVEHQAASSLPDTNISTTTDIHENETKINAPEEQVSLQQERVPDEGPAELTRMIGYLTATASEDWTLVLEVCDRASSSESNAKEAVRALRREFKYGEPPAQLSAARLWAIMLRNSSDTFISQSTSRKFLDTLEDLLQSSWTSPVVRERLLEVVAAAAYASGAKKDPRENRDGFKGLWRRVKPFDQPEEGVPFDTDDSLFNPPVSGHLSDDEVLMVHVQEVTPVVNPNTKPSTSANTVVLGELTSSHQRYPNSEHTVEKRPSPSGATGNRIGPREEDIRRLFQECNIGQGNASLLSQALALSKPEDLEKKSLIKEFHAKCRTSQELIYSQIPWASVGAERSRVKMNTLRMARGDGNGHATRRSISKNDQAIDDEGETGAQGRENGDVLPIDVDETVEEKLFAALLQANEELMEALTAYDDLVRTAQEDKAEEWRRIEARRVLKQQQQQQLQREHINGNTPVPVEQNTEQEYKDPRATAPLSHSPLPLPPNAMLITPHQPAPPSSSLLHTDHTLHNADYQLQVHPVVMPQRAQHQHPQRLQQYPQAVSSNSAPQRDPSGTDNITFDPPMSTDLPDSGAPTVQHRQDTSPPHATPPSEPDTDEIPPPRYSSIFPDVRRSSHRLAGWRTSIRQQRAKG